VCKFQMYVVTSSLYGIAYFLPHMISFFSHFVTSPSSNIFESATDNHTWTNVIRQYVAMTTDRRANTSILPVFVLPMLPFLSLGWIPQGENVR